jgi:hypothetical protein
VKMVLVYAIASVALLLTGYRDPQALQPLTTRIGRSTILIEQKKISFVRVLAGHVVVLGTDAPASGVAVDVCSADWKTVLASTKTDEKGYFSLGRQTSGKLLYLRLWSPGMDIYQLRVLIEKHAAHELRIRLSVAT